jgi:hypothetical protein
MKFSETFRVALADATIEARPPITGADHIITADTDIAPTFPVSE